MTGLVDWLLEQIAEDEAVAKDAQEEGYYPHFGETAAEEVLWMAEREGCSDLGVAHFARHDPDRVLAECEAKRRIVELHRDWPVLVTRPVEFEPSFGADLPLTDQMTLRASQQINWMTEQEYRAKFGDEPPTGPMIAALALPYADRPGYLEEWRP